MTSYATATIGATAGSTSIVSTVIDANHPYFLQTLDNLVITLVTQPLTNQIYYHRSRHVSISLSAKIRKPHSISTRYML